MGSLLNDHPKLVKLLLEAGADPNVRAEDGEPALILAAMNGNKEAVETLLDYGVDINTQITHNSPNIDAIHDQTTALIVVAEGGFLDVVELLLKRGADVNVQGRTGLSALMGPPYSVITMSSNCFWSMGQI